MTSIPLTAYQRQLKIVHYIRSEVDGRMKQESSKEDVDQQSDESDAEDLKEKVKKLDVSLFERILSKQGRKRTKDEKDTLLQLLDNVTFLKKFPRSVLMEISEAVRLETFDGFQVVFRQGEPGTKYYMILSGSVKVDIRGKGTVAQLGVGDSFGELALLKGLKRAGTVITTDSKVLFLTIDKADFDSILRKEHEKQVDERVQFFINLPLFVGWKRKQVERMGYVLRTLKYHGNRVISREGVDSPIYGLFFLSKGQCNVVRRVNLNVRDEETPDDATDLAVGSDGEKEVIVDVLKPGDFFGELQLRTRHNPEQCGTVKFICSKSEQTGKWDWQFTVPPQHAATIKSKTHVELFAVSKSDCEPFAERLFNVFKSKNWNYATDADIRAMYRDCKFWSEFKRDALASLLHSSAVNFCTGDSPLTWQEYEKMQSVGGLLR
uniref:Cyclic nucleotide-binding domain-containing protein n=1 Tax=Palpitomonas bilix TaxID=652834 RepID=A0A7S3GFF4_9EUKA